MLAKPLMTKFYPFDVVDVGLYAVNLVFAVDVAAQLCGVVGGR